MANTKVYEPGTSRIIQQEYKTLVFPPSTLFILVPEEQVFYWITLLLKDTGSYNESETKTYIWPTGSQ